MAANKRTQSDGIDYRRFGVVGYSHMAGYLVNKNATPHLLRFGTLTTLCGAETRGEKGRVSADQRERFEKPVCADCVRAQAEQDVPEHTFKLKKNACPKRSQDEGRSVAHNWISHRPRCPDCPKPNPYKATERCEKRKHPTTAWCNFCKAVDKERHFCDFTVGRSMGIATDFGACDKPAHVEQRYKRHLHDKWRWGWLCHLHTNEAHDARAAKFAAEMQANRDRWAERDKQADDEREARKILGEMARWIAANHELAEEDEWLGKIAERMAGNDTVMRALKGEKDEDDD